MARRRKWPMPVFMTFLVDVRKPRYHLIREFRDWLKQPLLRDLTEPHERKELFRLLRAGKTISEISKALGVPEATLRHWRNRQEWKES